MGMGAASSLGETVFWPAPHVITGEDADPAASFGGADCGGVSRFWETAAAAAPGASGAKVIVLPLEISVAVTSWSVPSIAVPPPGCSSAHAYRLKKGRKRKAAAQKRNIKISDSM